MATRGKGRSSSMDKAKEVFAQQIAHALGKGMTQNELVYHISSLMSTPVLAWLKALGPAFMAASTDSGLKFIQQHTGMFKGVQDPLLMEVLEAVFTGFFAGLPAGDATNDQAWSAMNKATTEAAAKFGRSNNPAAAGAIQKASYVINDKQLDDMVRRWGPQQMLQILRLYNIGIAAMAFAAFDPNTPLQVAMDAQFAFDDGDFSDLSKILTFAHAVKDNRNNFEHMVRASTAVVLANTAKHGWLDKLQFAGARVGAQAISALDGGLTKDNGKNVLVNWLRPVFGADAQVLAFILTAWLVFFLATAIPWFFLAPRGRLVWLVFFAVLNLLNNIALLNLLAGYMRLHTAAFELLGEQLRSKKKDRPETARERILRELNALPGDLHLILRFRWQASAPLVIGTALRFVFQFLFGPASFTFLYSMGLMVTAIAVAVMLVMRARADDAYGKFLLSGGVRVLPIALGLAVCADIYGKYEAGDMPDQGMLIFGMVGDWIQTGKGHGIGLLTMYAVLLLLLAAIVKEVNRRGNGGWGVAGLGVVLILLGQTVQCSQDARMNGGARLFSGSSREERKEEDHRRYLEKMQARKVLAQASAPPPIQIIGSSQGEARHNAMVALGGPTRREDHQRYNAASLELLPPPSAVRTSRREPAPVQRPSSGSIRPTTRFTLMCGRAPFAPQDSSTAARKQRYQVNPGNRVAVAVRLYGSDEYRYVPTARGDTSCVERAWLQGPENRSSDYQLISDLYVLQLDPMGSPIGGRRITKGASRAELHACGRIRCHPGSNAMANRLAASL